jgi:hypothetical protein
VAIKQDFSPNEKGETESEGKKVVDSLTLPSPSRGEETR